MKSWFYLIVLSFFVFGYAASLLTTTSKKYSFEQKSGEEVRVIQLGND